MRSILLPALMISMSFFVTSVNAQQYAGYAQREYRGRTYLYHHAVYGPPVWYAGNGVVKSKSRYTFKSSRPYDTVK